MSKITQSINDLQKKFGPNLNYNPSIGLDSESYDRMVKTHCCFCGVQCGIQLKVKDNSVVGFEPWQEFPVNKGKLCPKGVKRYLQNGHPDRLKAPLIKTEHGFLESTWEEVYQKTVSEIQRIQKLYGNDSFAFLGGASMTNEKAYLNGKFARLALKTANIDYNGRLCMVSAGAANKLAFGIDRAANPWSDISKTDLILIAGANVAECFPILTDYIWKARDNGAKIIVIDPRITPIARTCDLFLPVRPGTDSALANGILHQLVKNNWLDRGFIEAHTNGFENLENLIEKYTPEYTQKITGVPAQAIIDAGYLWGNAKKSMLIHARGIEHHTKGVENVLSYINLVLATGRIGKEGSGYGTITGQGNGQGGREHGQRCNQLPGGRDINNDQHRKEVCEKWGSDPEELPGEGLTACEIIDAIEEGKIKGLLSISFNPLVSIPDSNRTRKALEKLEFFGAIDFFLSETAQYADVVLAGSLQEEDEGTVTTGEGRCVRLRNSVSPPDDARVDWQIINDLAKLLGAEEYFKYSSAEEIFNELAEVSAGGVVDYSGMTYDRIETEMGIFWPCPEKSHPGTPRLFESDQKKFNHPDGRAKFHAFDFRPPAETTDPDYPIWFTSGRVVSQYLSGTQTRRIGSLVEQYPEPLCEIHPLLAKKLNIADGQKVKVSTRRGEIILPASVVKTIRPDTVFIPYHWPGKKSANQLTNRKLDPISKIPEFKVCSCRIEPLEQPSVKA